ncbi:hypothetical protein M2152_000527 [Microbacteriaceae bacterium SG_E_30_P1]|uniref:DUF4245 domain-containing protein n=1 Tax=Antiquaquibacter oligotrophicus TaxID=2880260 RepID=A0ABT6KK22_9MICO|nr:DUF4245 domain-containing protein [Antiquaquibacter oligotrophicus]MDH6180345.1 hypothetical protein [Antiquaquibacter oligotrophicus]UDF13912.1 DUF4245 domain-containing protein [Antiquaquibacter oligotrophicus]
MAEPRIVAELGRPETPQETADRKAAASAKRRANQTLFNLVVATVASLGIVLLLVIVVVRPTPEAAPPIDVSSVASSAESTAGTSLLDPDLPEGWSANAARFGTVDQVPTWYVGYVTPGVQFIAVNQGIDANATWLAAVVDDVEASGSATIDGVAWTLYDNRGADDPGNHAFAMSAELGTSTIVLHGTASDAEFQTLAAAISAMSDELE